MKLTKIAGDCQSDDCPTVYRTERGTLGVRGDLLDVLAGPGEGIVEIPESLLHDAARALGWLPA